MSYDFLSQSDWSVLEMSIGLVIYFCVRLAGGSSIFFWEEIEGYLGLLLSSENLDPILR